MTTAGHPPTAPTSHDVSTLAQLQPLLEAIDHLAEETASDPNALLALLRQLEGLHRSIQDGPFRSSLPSDRQRLFELLQSMERSGGWPYIPRLQLRTFLDLLNREPPGDDSPP
ncbi:hypothetical protein [Cyanobium sp. Morenito 9A2]|uniref:hypothetical protein n=1 Tax=Cyanobium sp. Morenito 9A2 TaxID=2823718 RepID=UPI0020CE190F|nr:hypothetical protein [Cyanobium sp. Morenito 9A2]MCP9849684.1 hypothetical protein [Cyanobium sp. Morenito 9A2]